ncbi:MAG: preprotein translocase subunit SecY [Chloroflexi bacterium]|nr:preprotein translocase subunit SecY [Chloroflexota bacterium]
MLQAAVNAFKIPDVRRKIVFTLAILIVARFIAHVPVPGIDMKALQNLFSESQLLGMLDLFSGGAMRTFSVAAMGVYPYITATIIMQLLTPIIPRFEGLSKEGEAGRNKLNQYTHWMTVPLAALQGYGQIAILSSKGILPTFNILDPNTALPSIAIIASMVAGTILLVWLGELITEYGIGNGISIIIFGGIVAGLPQLVQGAMSGSETGNIIGILVFAIIGLGTIVGIIMVNEGQRRIPVQYAKRIRGTRMYGGGTTHIPLRVNSAGMIPLIFAMSIMIFPSTVANFFTASSNVTVKSVAEFIRNIFDPNTIQYQLIYFLMVVGFTYFYTTVIFNQQNIPENLQKSGGFLPGIRPGRPTAQYLTRVLTRITLIGALFLGVVAVLPFFAGAATGVKTLLLSSTGLLIVVGVAIDTMKQLEAQLLMRNYEGFLK